MKKLVSTLVLICLASFSHAQYDFENQWKAIEKLENEGLIKNASELVETIYQKALSENKNQQRIKALLHKSKYMLVLEEEAQLKIVKLFLSEIDAIENKVTKHLLENMLATMYWQYFQQNRYKFYNRTKVSQNPSATKNEDFRTWDLETLFSEIHNYYQRSLEDEVLLQNENLVNYSILINEAENSKDYRPSLYDLLSHNALDFYKTDENSITKPSYQFKIDDDKFLSKAEAFVNLQISSEDSLSLQLNALKIYQNLLIFHQNNPKSLAFATVDIERMKFVAEHAVFPKVNGKLLSTLKEKAKALEHSELSALYNFEISSVYRKQGNDYDDANDNNRWKLKDAIELCEKVISDFPKSEGAKKCEILKQQIRRPNLRLTAESFIPVDQPSKILVSHKNLTSLQFNIYKVTKNELKTFNSIYRSNEKEVFFKKIKAFETFSARLKNEGDYQNHSTEIVFPKLQNGLYLIKTSTESEHEVFASSHIQVTNSALIESKAQDYVSYQLINRNNGKPIVNAKVNIIINRNNNTYSKNKRTDDFGKFRIEKSNHNYQYAEIQVNADNEVGYFGQYFINRNYNNQNRKTTQYNNFLFTDRSIYRPGQTVYFKGIATFTENDKTQVNPNATVKIRLKNVNDEIVKELTVETNEFGSVSGEFILPNDGLTGNFSIDMFCGNYGYTSFSVEEYKRPRFKPEFQPITKTYKVNDSITVNGKAVAFAGSNITNAKVVYKVKRTVQYPRWYYWSRPYFNSESQEVSFGETQTNDKGEFSITFKALPDENASKESLPIFNYEVTADITDLNGETRSTTTIVNVGYHAMTLNITAPTQIDKSKKQVELMLVSLNLNGEPVSTKGTLKMYKLTAPEQVLRPRPWEAPDYQRLTKEKFKNLFPHEAYTDESDMRHWKKGKEVFSTDFDTEEDKSIILKRTKKWKSGAYVIVAESKDKFGQKVKDEVFTTFYSPDDKKVSDNQLFTLQLDQSEYETNSIAKLNIGSAAKDITVTIEVEKNEKIILTQLINLSDSKETISIPVGENDLGGFVVHCSFSAFNYFLSRSSKINVPYPKTDLEIETVTFRDKLQPGKAETWSFKIKGPQGEKVSAELLASMYDASLDEFKSHSWNFNPINNPAYYSNIRKNSNQSFGTTNFRLYNNFDMIARYPSQSFDQLNWFGFGFNYSNYQLRQNYLRNQFANTPSTYSSKKKSDVVDGTIRGVITSADDGLPLPGATIIIDGTSRGTQSNFDGEFEIEAKKNEEVSVNYVGYKTLKFKIEEANFFNISLTPDAALEEVVVIGYGTTTKKSFTGSALAVSADESEEIYENSNNLNSNEKGTIENSNEDDQINKVNSNFDKVNIRKNLNETAFFFPKLKTDDDGNISFNFKTPEALTAWKLQLVAHTKNLESVATQLQTVTQKELMVIPNVSRFLREGDTITISTKIANLTEKQLSGITQLVLTDAITGNSLNNVMMASKASAFKTFSVNAKGNIQVSWSLSIPEGLQAVQYKIIAKAGDFSDGEQNVLPVLSNRMLVTETLPMWVRSNETKTFTLEKLKTNKSSTLKHHRLTLEITSNPAWYAVQALPYLMEYPYDCNEQTFARYYSNVLAQHIVKSNPKIEAVFNQWKSSDALLSNLEKNQELKSILIQETPWLRYAKSESEQKKRIGLLFDLNKMNSELKSSISKLKNNQYDSGAWPWFNGGTENRYITQHIIAGFGHLKKLNVIQGHSEASIIQKAIEYLDQQFVKEYKELRKYDIDVDLSEDHLSYTQLHYLYMRSFFPNIEKSKEVETIIEYYKGQIKNYWLSRSLYAKGLMVLVMRRSSKNLVAGKILKSLKENSITSDELGMHWKNNTNSWHWYQAPIETQALLIEAFSEAGHVLQTETENLKDIDNMKIWLLKHKQTNRWKTTKATTEAVYALLLQGSDWLDAIELEDIKVGDRTVDPSALKDVKLEAGTGYFKTSWTATEIEQNMADVTISKKGNGIAWGALYWQYFENLDKITSAETPLKLSKNLFLKENTATGEVITEITPNTSLKVGDLVRVRIVLQTNRNMEFIHLKDMRAVGFEPINVLSQYKWQDGLGYYESTKDAATNFFIDFLPKGIYVFEYDLRVNNSGDMSNGIGTIQSMYAPEFSSHSEGMRITIE